MAFNNAFAKLRENPKEVSEEALKTIVRIADNILKNPSNQKFRTLPLHNANIASKILTAKGAVDCLKVMGFQESNSSLVLPSNVPLDKIKQSRDSIVSFLKDPIVLTNVTEENKTKNSKGVERIQPVTLPPLIPLFQNPFLHTVEQQFHSCLQYADKNLQKRAKQLVPVLTLEESAQKKLRLAQEYIKKNKLEDPDYSIQDFLLFELLEWFKEDFFSWVDSPDCSNCGSKTKFSHMSTDPQLFSQLFAKRIELHRCESCQQFTPFPRYNDLNILLETRKGRCGEWANTFTLLCVAMGWDARYVVDSGDHVWTEVYSGTQKRWVHCDPCENVCDTPLMYETGWNKKISYVIAYSIDDVQDVTWRYSCNHKEVLLRRKSCTEAELVTAILKLRENRQKSLSPARRSYLTKRSLLELLELMMERKPKENEKVGRTSGAESWRLMRGETQENIDNGYVWEIKPEYLNDNKVSVTYSAATDKYQIVSGGKGIFEVEKWSKGVFDASSMFRKEEKDWKQVYLTRQEGTDSGSISWKFDLSNCLNTLDKLILNFQFTTFENGKVNVTICSGDKCILLPQDEKTLTTEDFAGSKSLTITANLTGGKGSVAWQHAQLFRQTTDSSEAPFSLTLLFK